MSTTNELAPSDNRLDWFKELYDQHKEEIIPLQDYLVQCQSDPSMNASSHERLLAAIGEPVLVDTRSEERLSRIFSNRLIRTYPSFSEFYGLEETIG